MSDELREDTENPRIDWFFRLPASGDPDGPRRSSLYVLRRDLCNLVGAETNSPVDPTAPMLATIGMMSGIDLMTWTREWPNEPGREEFVKFLRDFGQMQEDEAEALYQYRCAQVHSYGLISVRRSKKDQKEFTFTVDPSTSARLAIEFRPNEKYPNNYVVSLAPLKRLFLKIVLEYEKAVRRDPEQRRVFLEAIEKIGFFYIQSDWYA